MGLSRRAAMLTSAAIAASVNSPDAALARETP